VRQIRKIITIQQACEMTKLSESTLNRKIRKNTFPPKIERSDRLRGFYEDTVIDWVNNRPEATRQ